MSNPKEEGTLETSIIPGPEKFNEVYEKFIYWSTTEYVEGRPFGPLRASSARQVLGTIGRFLAWLRIEEPLLSCNFSVVNCKEGRLRSSLMDIVGDTLLRQRKLVHM